MNSPSGEGGSSGYAKQQYQGQRRAERGRERYAMRGMTALHWVTGFSKKKQQQRQQHISPFHPEPGVVVVGWVAVGHVSGLAGVRAASGENHNNVSRTGSSHVIWLTLIVQWGHLADGRLCSPFLRRNLAWGWVFSIQGLPCHLIQMLLFQSWLSQSSKKKFLDG
jgi:hypothetical protein